MKKQITLRRLCIRNFKGLKSLDVELNGENKAIVGANGNGKTTVYDAYLWLLFGKDSTGRTEFGIRPLDDQNRPIKGLVVEVTGVIEIDGQTHVLKKEHHEVPGKDGQIKRHETKCWVDEVSKLVSKYNEYVGEVISEDAFKMLADLRHFCEKLPWKDRRAVLLDIAGGIGTPTGFDTLLGELNGRSLDDYKKVLAARVKRAKEQREEIGPRIDEIQKGLVEYAGNTDSLEAERGQLNETLAKINADQQTALASEQERQAKIDRVNVLKADRLNREAFLANDTSQVKHLFQEKSELETATGAAWHQVTEIQRKKFALEGQAADVQNRIDADLSRLNAVRQELADADAQTEQLVRSYTETAEHNTNQVKQAVTPDTCFECGGALPPEKIAELQEKKQAKLANIIKERDAAIATVQERGASRANEIVARGNALNENIKAQRAELEQLQVNIGAEQAKLTEAESNAEAIEQQNAQRVAEIEQAIASDEKTPPQQDKQWQDITALIEEVTAEIGEPLSERLKAIEQSRTEVASSIAELDKALAQADRAKQDKARIEELEALEIELAQTIADLERQLKDIDNYKAAENQMIEAAVNGMFKHVEFRLFKTDLKGNLIECCDPMLNGVPYIELSTGEKIIVGIDIINVLAEHHKLHVPLFIDRAESVTLPIETNCQTVQLFAKKGQPLTVKAAG